ncbi:hypothetical protein [Pseudooceanicola sp. HF7]|uniref:hypothetical protein n=1 Tax=Pseudooceanicola sp. HF7 TaxID=2721560 RepID=UPI001431503B|nr:hypothetical protein [Pseudooceanicola sp. HF7]NIZ09187.1 hypothetical protein [Pseudooceanicola sp. HF7]
MGYLLRMMILRPLLLTLPLLMAACSNIDGVLEPAPAQAPSVPPPEDIVPEDPDAVESGVLGTTIATLGAAGTGGMWLETPLVSTRQAGSVRSAETGKSVAVTLIPIDGPKTAGSRLSLKAMQALGVPLSSLAEVEVSA